ncbi:MAG TPA: TldD/PmbA family protein [Candidatus Wallbacteria bacterium]|nr:TldD/PmbA family protein [Candidatus Wallbacteria bacterium]
MFKFPKNLYTDVRIEDVFETRIAYTLNKMDENRTRKYIGAFIRVFDGERWYYSATTNVKGLQAEIDSLACVAKKNPGILKNKTVKKMQVNASKRINYADNSIEKIKNSQKDEYLQSYFGRLNSESKIKMWRAIYSDRRVVKKFVSSQGACVEFDNQKCGAILSFDMSYKKKMMPESFQVCEKNFESLFGQEEKYNSYLKKCFSFIEESAPVKPGRYNVILSPMTAGIFAHESFGHKSEADFMTGDETMKKEWAIGKKVGAPMLTICDGGNHPDGEDTPFDDEGNIKKETFLIKKGVLSGRLHSASTAADLDEEVTGNARAVSFEFEPIVRMTNTYIKAGNMTREELFKTVKNGIYVEKLKHGSGMSTFTLAPSLAYEIKDSKIGRPLNVAVITGNVFETLNDISGLSNEIKIYSSVSGGCGKMAQYPLSVSFGGPYTFVKNMNVQ